MSDKRDIFQIEELESRLEMAAVNVGSELVDPKSNCKCECGL